VTVVLTDLVDSTKLVASVPAGAADRVRRTHFHVLEEAAASTGGSVVKTLGDGVMVSYESAAQALAGAVAMQRAVARHNRRPGSPTSAMRVGLSIGEATFEDGDWFVPPVVEAARLCAEAEGGQILTTDVLRALVGTRAELGFAFDYGFNVESAGDSPVWHQSEVDVVPGHQSPTPHWRSWLYTSYRIGRHEQTR